MSEEQKVSPSEAFRHIQLELKARKDQHNNFGGYDYRSAESILESVKPLLEKYGGYLNLTDTAELIGERYYIKATATYVNGDFHQTAVGYARESLQKKGMDDSQVTGATSSYARKYALNGLFCIDDNKDADTDEYSRQVGNLKTQAEKVSDIRKELQRTGLAESTILKMYKINSLAEISEDSYKNCMARFKNTPTKGANG